MTLVEKQKEDVIALVSEGKPLDWKPMFTVTSDIYAVEQQWRALEKFGIQSPGQSFDFVRSWVEQCEIPSRDQFYVIAYRDKEPLVVLPVMKTKKLGATVLTWFTGAHVACNAPLINNNIMATFSEQGRKDFWQLLLDALPPSDAVYFPSVPTGETVEFEAFEGQAKKPVCDHVYRTKFASWDEADAARRDRKRRRRDKQHAQKLEALGTVELKNFSAPDEIENVLNVMFEQRHVRFEQMDIDDPFSERKIRNAYSKVFTNAQTIKPILYALLLNNQVIAVRYCVEHENKLFMLISSMSDDQNIMTGSPGSQCLIEILKAKLGPDGYNMVDIGVGESDEKRRWCNELLPVYNCYIPRNFVGWSFFVAQAGVERLKMAIKGNQKLFTMYKNMRGSLPSFLRK